MKPNVIGMLFILVVVIVNFGNGCAPSFKTIEPATSGSLLNASSCAHDESSLVSLVQNWREGYLHGKKVLYYMQGDGWIVVEGDKMYKSNGPLPSQPPQSGISQGVGVPSSGIWPGGNIPYVIDSALPNQQRVADAINHWNTNLAGVIRWYPRTTETDYVVFQYNSSGCSSPVGYYVGGGVHPVQLSNDCGSGNVAHEMGHIAGLDHEQNRLDRDSYITIHSDKIQSGYALNFDITAGHMDYGSYDFGSIMHYGLTAFSTDGVSHTIDPLVAIPSGTIIGQRAGLSNGDISSVRTMYGADSSSGTGTVSGSGSTGTTGLFGHYYDGVDFVTLKKEQLDSTLDFSWGANSPVSGVGADFFSVRWNGWLQPSTSNTYTIVASGADGYRVTLNGTVLIDNLSSGSGYSSNTSTPIQLWSTQQYEIIVETVARRTGSASFHLSWIPQGGSQSVIPTANFIPDSTSAASNMCTL